MAQFIRNGQWIFRSDYGDEVAIPSPGAPSDAAVPYRQRFAYDANGNTIFVGWAVPGTLVADPHWRIQQMVYSSTLVNGNYPLIETLWVDGDTKFDNIWSTVTAGATVNS